MAEKLCNLRKYGRGNSDVNDLTEVPCVAYDQTGSTRRAISFTVSPFNDGTYLVATGPSDATVGVNYNLSTISGISLLSHICVENGNITSFGYNGNEYRFTKSGNTITSVTTQASLNTRFTLFKL